MNAKAISPVVSSLSPRSLCLHGECPVRLATSCSLYIRRTPPFAVAGKSGKHEDFPPDLASLRRVRTTHQPPEPRRGKPPMNTAPPPAGTDITSRRDAETQRKTMKAICVKPQRPCVSARDMIRFVPRPCSVRLESSGNVLQLLRVSSADQCRLLSADTIPNGKPKQATNASPEFKSLTPLAH